MSWGELRQRQPRGKWHESRFLPHPSKTEVACGECGRPMWLPPSKVEGYQRCGPACNAAWRARKKEDRRRSCETCGGEFYPRRAQINAGGGRFCSQKCNTTARDALQSPESKAKAAEGNRRAIADGRKAFPVGPNHHSWRGGWRERAKLKKRGSRPGPSAAYLRAYRKSNPDKVREWAQRRSGRKIGRLPYGTIPAKGRAQNWRCAICSEPIRAAYHVDHITPLVLRGEHASRNIQLLCESCNVRKNGRDPIEYMRSLGRLL